MATSNSYTEGEVLKDLAYIAPDYDATSSYAVGDYVKYGGAIYKCKTAVGSTGEAWTAAHWESVGKVADALVALARKDKEIESTIASDYDESSTYELHDVVRYDGKFYRCVVEIMTAEAWTAAHWSLLPSTIAQDVEDLKLREVTWSELKDLRDNGKLQPGINYRITDYQCTTTREDTQSAGHQFDIIVVADDESTLNENARAIQHEGDTYFAECNLSAWRLKYSLDNKGWSARKGAFVHSDNTGLELENKGTIEIGGTTYYLWYNSEIETDTENGATAGYLLTSTIDPDSLNDGVPMDTVDIATPAVITTEYDWTYGYTSSAVDGTGVIIRMIDEYRNDIPYDFKNIQFKRYKITACAKATDLVGKYAALNCNGITVDESDYLWCYTFSTSTGSTPEDTSIDTVKYVANHRIAADDGYLELYDNVFVGFYLNSTILGLWCNGNTFYNCNYNTFGRSCNHNTFVNNCSFNTFVHDCNHNTFVSGCNSNTFPNGCQNNTFVNDCQNNTFGNSCSSNTFVNDCSSNIFGNDCNSNTFGSNCNSNTFGNNCQNNTFGNNCYCNTFGNNCYCNRFGTSSASKSYCRYIALEDGVSYTYLNCTATTSGTIYWQNVHINSGVKGTSSSSRKTITFTEAGKDYLTTVGSASDTEMLV